jgi:hypothetical protein
MKMAIGVATMREGTAPPGDISLATCNATHDMQVVVVRNTPEENLGVVGSYQKIYESTDADIICYMHDDVIVRERGWDERILQQFDARDTGVVGFGGAEWHGTPELYKTRYTLGQLRRGEYRSNVDDAEVHGERFAGACDVAVLDGYCLAVRRSFLERSGGWAFLQAGGIDFFCYDYAICALARRYQYRVRCVGIRCHHRGGGTSVLAKTGIASPEAYEASHRWFYEEFKDVMPCRVNPQSF